MKVSARFSALLVIALAVAACSGTPSGGVQGNANAEASATPKPSASPRPSFAPRPTAPPYIADTEPGDPLPDELIGAWYEPPGRLDASAWVWFIRAGDPYCVQVMHTNQDCHVFHFNGEAASVGSEGAIVTMVDGVITMLLIRGSCHEQSAKYTYAIVDDVLTMTNIPTCFTDSYRLFRAGTNGAPEAPASPAP